jgi:hypothetical protein
MDFKLKHALIIYLYVVISAFGSALSASAETDYQTWSLFIYQGSSANRLRTYVEIQPRFGNNVSRLDQILLRPAVWYALRPNLSLWLGYAWTPGFNPRFQNEQRLWQQMIYDKSFGPVTYVNRLRLEQRFIDGIVPVAHRIRNMFRLTMNLGSNNLWQAAVWDEIFLNINSASPTIRSGFQQNRLFLGANHLVIAQTRVEAGYLFNYIVRPGIAIDRINHAAFFMITTNY